MFARYISTHRIALIFAAFFAGSLSLQAQAPVDQTVTGSLTVKGSTFLEGTLSVDGDTDIFGNTFTLGNSLTDPNLAGLEIYIQNFNTSPLTRYIDQVTTLDGTTFRWGMKSTTLNDIGTEWMSLNSSTLTLSGNLVVNNGTENKLMAQTLNGGASSILTLGLADARYLQLTNTDPLTISNTTAAISSATGALVVSGGLGVVKDSWINGVRLGRGLADVSSNTALGGGTLNTNTTGSNNTAVGFEALLSNTTGSYNTANGTQALNSNTTGNANTANGYQALYSNTTGNSNIANVYKSLYSNTTGHDNTANGIAALYYNTTGSNNIANGNIALYYNTTGYQNIANGAQTLYFNTTGYNNIANGYQALYANTTGHDNITNGPFALTSNTTGYSNVANGVSALFYNTTGHDNTANGTQSLEGNTTGYQNTADGVKSLYTNTTGNNNTALGYRAGLGITTGSGNTILGANVTGLPIALTNNIILANGTGAIKAQHDGTNWTLTGGTMIASGSISASTPVLNTTQTWNAGAIVFTGIKSNITDTASAAGSLLLDLQVDGVSKFSVDKAGNVSSPGNLNITGSATLNSQAILTTFSGDARYATLASDTLAIGSLASAQPGGLAIGYQALSNANAVSIGVWSGNNGYLASGVSSVAIGHMAHGVGDRSIGIGASWAEGLDSVALGTNATTRQPGGVAIGRGVESTQVGQIVLGSYNVLSSPSSSASPTDELFIVANGTANTPQDRSNAFVIKRNGDTEIKGGASVQGNLNVQQNATVTGQLIISNPAGGISMGEFGNP